MKTFKIYAPTISGAKEMFSDYEKDMAQDPMREIIDTAYNFEDPQDRATELEIEQIQEEKLEAKAREDTADCHASPEDSCSHCQELGLER